MMKNQIAHPDSWPSFSVPPDSNGLGTVDSSTHGQHDSAPGPTSPGPRPPAPRVLLIQNEWPARAILKAELEARGCDVLGADTLRTALDLSTLRGFRPSLVVVDTVGLEASEAELQSLQTLRHGAPLILLASAQLASPLINTLSPSLVLKRPLSVGQVSDVILDLS